MHTPNEPSYVKGFFVKCLENMSSAKMWLFLLPFAVSSVFMAVFLGFSIEMIRGSLHAAGVSVFEMTSIITQLKIAGDVFIAWCTFNVSLATVIIAVREIFKVKKLKALKTATEHCEHHIHKIST
jgi:hypothetical protein